MNRIISVLLLSGWQLYWLKIENVGKVGVEINRFVSFSAVCVGELKPSPWRASFDDFRLIFTSNSRLVLIQNISASGLVCLNQLRWCCPYKNEIDVEYENLVERCLEWLFCLSESDTAYRHLVKKAASEIKREWLF